MKQETNIYMYNIQCSNGTIGLLVQYLVFVLLKLSTNQRPVI